MIARLEETLGDLPSFEEVTTHFASEPFFVPFMILLLNCQRAQEAFSAAKRDVRVFA
jgi:hypothetical protein